MKKYALILFFTAIVAFSSAQSITLKDFERMPSVKSLKEYLAKKDFTVKQDSSSGENIRLRMLNRATREIIYVLVNKDSEGARYVEVEYFTESQEEYAKLVHTVAKYGYTTKGDNRHYEKRLGSYETQNLLLKEMVLIKDKDYYGIKYSYYAGKELSVVPPAADK